MFSSVCFFADGNKNKARELDMMITRNPAYCIIYS